MCKEFKCLPYTGSLYEQDNKMLEMFELINSEVNKHEHDEIEKSNKEMKRKSGNQN